MKCPVHEKCPYRSSDSYCMMEDYGLDPQEDCDAILWEYEDEESEEY